VKVVAGLASAQDRLNRNDGDACDLKSIFHLQGHSAQRCGFFETGPQFVPILRKQREHAADNDQVDRAQLFTSLLDAIDADD